MGIPRLLFLKQIYTNPTKPYFNLTRTLTSATKNIPIFQKIISSVTNSPNASVVPLLEQHLIHDKTELQTELPKIIRKLRKLKRYERAHEVSEWTSRNSLNRTDKCDLALQLDLIGKVHGVDAAEKFFNKTGEHSEGMYGSLLNCYVQAKLVDKSLSHFNKMKKLGIATSTLTYNSIMSLYQKTDQSEKIPGLLLEMQEKGISPDDVSYRTCLKAYALIKDFNSIEKLLDTMENLLKVDWFTYCSVANYCIEGEHLERAVICLKKAEIVLQDNPVGFNNLISMYSKLGDVDEVTRLWENQKEACKLCNSDYMVMLSALVKLDKFQEAEKLLEEYELSEIVYDSRVTEILLNGYAQKGRVEKAEKLLESMIGKNKTRASPSSWCIISEGYVNRMDMKKAVQCMEKALKMGPQHKSWVPKKAVISSILNWIGNPGDFDQVYDFLKLMSRVVPMNRNMHQVLQKACKRHGKDISDVLRRLENDKMNFDEDTIKIMKA